jgi:SAM-dependent methyltransferase
MFDTAVPAPTKALENCYFCKNTRGQAWVTKDGFHYRQCQKCKLVWTEEGLVFNDQGENVYEAQTPVFMQDGNASYYLDETNLLSARKKFRWLQTYLPAGSRIADIGANYGHFLKECGNYYAMTGIELSPVAVEWSRKHFAVNNNVGSVYDLARALPEKVDGVTFWDVIEHIPDPKLAIQQIHQILNPGGSLFVSTPDAGSWVAKIMGVHWHYLDPVQHIVLFNRQNLTALLIDCGFEIKQTKTCGHYYRVGYVFDRLCYLHKQKRLGKILQALRPLWSMVAGLKIYLNLFDVMAIVAVKKC